MHRPPAWRLENPEAGERCTVINRTTTLIAAHCNNIAGGDYYRSFLRPRLNASKFLFVPDA